MVELAIRRTQHAVANEARSEPAMLVSIFFISDPFSMIRQCHSAAVEASKGLRISEYTMMALSPIVSGANVLVIALQAWSLPLKLR